MPYGEALHAEPKAALVEFAVIESVVGRMAESLVVVVAASDYDLRATAAGLVDK